MDSVHGENQRPRLRIGWLSGVSRPGSVALSPGQRAFLDALPGEAQWKLPTNFPYGPGKPEGEFRRTPLLAASAVNGWRFAASSLPFRRRHLRTAWSDVRTSCDSLLLVTLSTGSQIAQAFERRFLDEPEARGAGRLTLFSMGAVDWGCASLEQHRVRGDKDTVARPFARPGDRLLGGVKHLDYTGSGEALDACSRWILDELSRDGIE